MSDDGRAERIAAAVAGNLPLSSLSDLEREEANKAIDAAIANIGGRSFVDRLAERGVTTFFRNEQGHDVVRHPDGGEREADPHPGSEGTS